MTKTREQQIEEAQATFSAYFARNYPGPHTEIQDPHWHAPKIFRAALAALEDANPAAREQAEDESGLGESHEAHRYRKIHPAVMQMGGWANFSHWVLKHAENYFDTCGKMEAELQSLREENKRLRKSLAKYPCDTEQSGFFSSHSRGCRKCQALSQGAKDE